MFRIPYNLVSFWNIQSTQKIYRNFYYYQKNATLVSEIYYMYPEISYSSGLPIGKRLLSRNCWNCIWAFFCAKENFWTEKLHLLWNVRFMKLPPGVLLWNFNFSFSFFFCPLRTSKLSSLHTAFQITFVLKL